MGDCQKMPFWTLVISHTFESSTDDLQPLILNNLQLKTHSMSRINILIYHLCTPMVEEQHGHFQVLLFC